MAEVLVALVVISVSFIALMKVSSDVTRNYAYMQNKLTAHRVAKYHVTNLSVRDLWPDLGKEKSQMQMSGRNWFLHQEVFKTTEPNFRRVEVAVSTDQKGNNSLVTFIGFIREPNNS